MKIIYISLLLESVSAIKFEKVSPSHVYVKQGGSFKVICTADYWYEVPCPGYSPSLLSCTAAQTVQAVLSAPTP